MRVCLFPFGVLCRLPDRDRHKGRHRGQRRRPKSAPPSAIRKPHAGPVIIQQAEPTGLLYTAVRPRNDPRRPLRSGTENCPPEKAGKRIRQATTSGGETSVHPGRDIFFIDTTNHPRQRHRPYCIGKMNRFITIPDGISGCVTDGGCLHAATPPCRERTPRRGPPCSYPAMPGKETPPAATGTGLFRTGSTAFRL